MRNKTFESNRYYLLFNEGVNSMDIFIDDQDRARFLFLILYFQSPTQINNISWYARSFVKNGLFKITPKTTNQVLKERYVDLISFNVKNNNFTLLIHNKEEGCISVYMQRILTSYSKYFNKKYNRKGHLFRSSFEASLVSKNDILQTVKDIHKDGDKWSSFMDYTNKNRWENLLRVVA